MKEHPWKPYPVTEQIHIHTMYTLFCVHYEKDFAFLGESHNFWECLYVLDGEVCVSADERVYNLMRGEIIFHKPLEFHKFTINSSSGADLLIFSFSADGPLTDWFRDKVFGLSNTQMMLLKNLLSYTRAKSSSEEVSRSSSTYLMKPFLHQKYYSQMVTTYLYQLFLSLADEGSVSAASSAPDAVIFSKAICYLNDNLHTQPSVRQIAHFCNISESGLKRIFDKYAGVSVHKYLTKLKIKAAVELLQNGKNVSEVSETLGFNSQSYFSKAFRRETGTAPSSLKQNSRPNMSAKEPNS